MKSHETSPAAYIAYVFPATAAERTAIFVERKTSLEVCTSHSSALHVTVFEAI